MSREVDKRDFSVDHTTPTGTAGLTAAAGAVSDNLPGPHRVRIKGFDTVTGNPSGLVSTGAPTGTENYVARALQHLQSVGPALGLSAAQPNEFAADPHPQTTSSGAVVVHLQQHYKSIPIFQADQSLNFTPDGAIDQTNGTTVTVPNDVSAVPGISLEAAVLKAAQFLAVPESDEQGQKDAYGVALPAIGVDLTNWRPKRIATFSTKADVPSVLEAGPFGDVIKGSLIWFWMNGGLRLAWHLMFAMPSYEGQYRVIVDAQTGDILYSHQLVQSVIAIGNVFQKDGSMGRVNTNFPRPVGDYGLPPVSLPNGFPNDWVTSNSTVGNAVNAHLEDTGPPLTVPASGGILTFNPADPASDDQKVLNLFYYACYMHDYLYLLGFREADGNFQQNNLGNGGAEGDPLDARAYQGAVWATASMATPADGSSPLMKMGLVPDTNRHTALDSTVVFHEYTHGLTNRLVGGPMNDQALDAQQSAGMGEGWSDYVACTITGEEVIAAWVLNTANGARAFRYDGNYPDTFADLGTGRYTEMHNIGEIWCAALLEMNRAIGSALGIQLVVDSLKLTPANPSFPDARDAIFLALDHMLSSNKLTAAQHDGFAASMWKVFARFGLGPKAQSNGASLSGIVADFQAPETTQSHGPVASGNIFVAIGSVANGLPASTAVAGVSSGPGRLDLFAVAAGGGIHTSFRGTAGSAWAGWSAIAGAAAPAAPVADVAAVSASADRVDLFVVAGDGEVLTTARTTSAGAWAGWSRIGMATDRAPAMSVVNAVSTGPDRIDVFIVASDGGIYTAGRAGSAASWSEWARVGSASDAVPVLSVVTAVSAAPGRIDLFVVAADGNVYTTARLASDGVWADWSKAGASLTPVLFPVKSAVTALSPQAGEVDLFAVAADGGIYSCSRPGTGGWSSWARVGGAADTVPLPCTVGATSPGLGQVSLFVTGSDGGVYTVSRSATAAAWTDWARVGTATDQAPLHSVIRAASAKAGELDLFLIGNGGVVYFAAIDA